jgi:SAM-dependent methyltransferase
VTNYQHDLWASIYDQYNQGRHEQELAFYTEELRACTGPILEVACGTGMILLPMLEQGMDVYGFDISAQMLDVLYAKAEERGLTDIRDRVTCQNMVDFCYDVRFDAIFIPARSFLHLTSQDEQIACLTNIRAHLKEGGRFLLNFFTPSLKALLRHAGPAAERGFAPLDTYILPGTDTVVELSVAQESDLASQVQHITWRFTVGGVQHEIKMFVRWIYKQEFQLLLRLAGFRRWEVYSGFEKRPYDGDGEMVWIVEK